MILIFYNFLGPVLSQSMCLLFALRAITTSSTKFLNPSSVLRRLKKRR